MIYFCFLNLIKYIKDELAKINFPKSISLIFRLLLILDTVTINAIDTTNAIVTTSVPWTKHTHITETNDNSKMPFMASTNPTIMTGNFH